MNIIKLIEEEVKKQLNKLTEESIYDPRFHKYAVVSYIGRNNYILYGVGRTEDDAIRDSEEWLNMSFREIKIKIENPTGFVGEDILLINDPEKIRDIVEKHD